MTYPRSTIPEPYQKMVRSELRKIPTWKLQEAYGKLKAGEPTGMELVERDRAYAISAIEEALWERGKLPPKGSHSSGAAKTTTEEWNRAFEHIIPVAGIGLAAVSLALGFISLRDSLGQRIYYQDGQYLVAVRYPGEWNELRDFVQPADPDVLAIYSQYGPDPWGLYDFVCRNISYRRDVGEFWQTPRETLQGYGDCEDSANLLTSLLGAGQISAYTAIGSYVGYGHAWCQLDGQILETTYTSARPVPDPQDYCPYVLFSDQEVIELWPGALSEVFEMGRDEKSKLGLMAEALGDEAPPECPSCWPFLVFGLVAGSAIGTGFGMLLQKEVQKPLL